MSDQTTGPIDVATQPGMLQQAITLRDYFACEAMAALLHSEEGAIVLEDATAAMAYSLADAMIRERQVRR